MILLKGDLKWLKKELIEKLESLNKDDVIKFYIWDYEYNDDDPYDYGVGKLISVEKTEYGNYINIGINKIW